MEPAQDRIRSLNSAPVNPAASYVLYWAQANRRADSNHALIHAVDVANSLRLPVLFYEGLTCDYPYANDRLHTFILEGVPETARRVRKLGLGYAFYLRRRRRDPNDILYRLARDAAAVIADDYPVFLPKRHNQSVPPKLNVAFRAVDSSCVVPMSRFEKREYAAYTLRPKLRRLLPAYLAPAPAVKVVRRWRAPAPQWHTEVGESDVARLVAACEIDHSVAPSTWHRGGRLAAEARLAHFLKNNLRRYARLSREPSAHATSNLSPYLHFGVMSSLEVALAVRAWAEEHKLIAEEFLEELIVRRELAFNFARHSEQPDSLDNLPDWARGTLDAHDGDRREHTYSCEDFEAAATHDALWNATQKEMLARGTVHGYYRMYWGKKIIQWSRSHQEALATMVRIHDRWALDGRDPNTYANILWCFGLHDRPWGERPVFGTVRYMSLDGMKRKTGVDAYLEEAAGL